MEFDVATLLLLAFSGLCAGFIDAIAGGGGLITLPYSFGHSDGGVMMALAEWATAVRSCTVP